MCVGDGGMSPGYFMHTLTFREAALFLEGFSQRVKREWSQAKYEAYWAACPHLKNFRYDDMPQFSWERGDDEMVDEAQQLREIEELRELARRSNANNDTNTLQHGDR